MVVTLGQQYNVGEKPTVILDTQQHIGEVRSKIQNSEREFCRIPEFGNEIDYGVKTFQGKIGANRFSMRRGN